MYVYMYLEKGRLYLNDGMNPYVSNTVLSLEISTDIVDTYNRQSEVDRETLNASSLSYVFCILLQSET